MITYASQLDEATVNLCMHRTSTALYKCRLRSKECVERGKHPHPLPKLPGVQFFLGRPNRRARTSWRVSRWPVQSIVRNLVLHPGPLGHSDFPNAWSANHYKGFSPPSPQEFTPNPRALVPLRSVLSE